MIRRLVALLAFWLSVQPASAADPLPDYIRYAEGRQDSRLEVAIRSFQLPSGQTVDLIGVVHIADAAYYSELNRRFTGYDSVLFEMVGDPSGMTRPAEPDAQTRHGGGAVSSIQRSASKYLDLAYQLNAIDYTARNLVHADVSAREFAQMQAERGENVMTLFVRAMQAQMGSQMNRTAMRELDTFGLIRILMSPDSAAEFKKSLAKVFDQMESMTIAMEGAQGSAVLSGRNDVVMKKLKEVLARKQQRRIAVFYGGAHMPGIEAALIGELDARSTGEEWLAAWTMPKIVKPKKPTTPPADTNPAP